MKTIIKVKILSSLVFKKYCIIIYFILLPKLHIFKIKKCINIINGNRRNGADGAGGAGIIKTLTRDKNIEYFENSAPGAPGSPLLLFLI